MILRHAKYVPLLQELLDLDQQCVLLQLLLPKSGSALEPSSEFHEIFRAANSTDRKFLELELSVGYQLPLANLTLLHGVERHRVQLQLVRVFRAVPFRPRLRR